MTEVTRRQFLKATGLGILGASIAAFLSSPESKPTVSKAEADENLRNCQTLVIGSSSVHYYEESLLKDVRNKEIQEGTVSVPLPDGKTSIFFGKPGERLQYFTNLLQIDTFNLCKPKHIVLYVGANNVYDEEDMKLAANRAKELIEITKTRFPEAKITYPLVYPTRYSQDDPQREAKRVAFNKHVTELLKPMDVRILDLEDLIPKDETGRLDAEAFRRSEDGGVDPVHLNEEYLGKMMSIVLK